MALNDNEAALYALAERSQTPLWARDPVMYAVTLGSSVYNTDGSLPDTPFKVAEGEAPKLRASMPSQGDEIFRNIDEQVAGLETLAGDREAFISGLARVQSSIAAKEADFRKEAQTQAAIKTGVKDFEKALQDSIMMDRNTPEWVAQYGTADSDETIQARKNLIAAQNAAMGASDNFLRENPAYGAFRSYAETKLKGAEAMFVKGMDRQEKLEFQADVVMSGYMPEQRQALAEISGFQTPVEQWKFMEAQGNNKKFLQETISASPKELPVLALSGNPYARRLVEKKEGAVLGEAEAGRLLGELDKIVSDPVEANKKMVDFNANAGISKEKQKENADKAAKALLQATSGTASDKKEAAMFRMDLAKNYASYLAQTKFDSDMLALRGKSKERLPAFLDEASKDQKTGPLTKEKAIILAKQAPTVQEQQKRINQLVAYYGSAAETQNRSLLFKIEPLAPEKLRVEATMAGYGTLGKIGRFAIQEGTRALDVGKRQVDVLSGLANLPFNAAAEYAVAEDPLSLEPLRRGYLRGQPFGTKEGDWKK